MDEKRNRVSQYTGGAVVVVSTAPLIGQVELAVAGEEPVHLRLDRKSARQLASALVDFLGDDAPPRARARSGDEALRPEDLNASNDD